MSLLSTLLALLMSIHLVVAENCTPLQVHTALQPMANDSNFATCQSDYTSSANPTLNQTATYCGSSACQTLLSTILSSGLLPDCQVAIDMYSFNITDVVSAAANCSNDLHEHAVSKKRDHNALGHTADMVATIITHSIPW